MSFTLLTGCTGLVGHYLMRDLQLAGRPLATLVRPNRVQSAADRLDAQLDVWANQGHELTRPVLLEGDLCEPNCGLLDHQVEWLKNHCSAVVHSGASVSFNETPAGEPRRTNVEGTQSLIDLCRQAEITEFHLISTAYVCGLRRGTILESETREGQKFRNAYEQSKLEAEELVRLAPHLRHPSIYRPPFIAGDSKTGFTTSFHGLFHYLRLIALIVQQQETDGDGLRRVQFRLPCSGEQRRNCVPIDWVSQVITRLVEDETAAGKTYHITAENRITARDIIDYASSYFQSTGVTYDEPFDAEDANDLELLARDYLEIYEPYESFDPDFDVANLHQHLADLPCPKIDEAMVHRYIEFGERHQWGKRRPSEKRRRLST